MLLSILAFIGVISYRRPGLTHRVFKNIPLIDWINILIIPITVYFALTLIVKNILDRPAVAILDFEDSSLLSFGLLFLIYAFVGNSIHFVAKVLSRYIPQEKHSIVYQINEIFHGKLSHYMVYICALLLVFITALLEINHPLSSKFSKSILRIIYSCGLLIGFSSAKTIFYTGEWYGGNKKPFALLISLLFLILFLYFKMHHLNYGYYPMNLFAISFFVSFLLTFIIRQLLIFSRLSHKRRLRFLAKLLSI